MFFLLCDVSSLFVLHLNPYFMHLSGHSVCFVAECVLELDIVLFASVEGEVKSCKSVPAWSALM